MSFLVLDDHLLRDLLADEIPPAIARLLRRRQPATTNMYHLRLCRSAVSARGGQLTGGWPSARRLDLARTLSALPEEIHTLPMRDLAFRMAQVSGDHPVSTLGAEAVAAAEALKAPLCVWSGDDGPGIRAAAKALRVDYRPIER